MTLTAGWSSLTVFLFRRSIFKKYRRCIGLVNQEPTMISGSIKMNLRAGLDEEHVTDAAIENACKQANIYDFSPLYRELFLQIGNETC